MLGIILKQYGVKEYHKREMLGSGMIYRMVSHKKMGLVNFQFIESRVLLPDLVSKFPIVVLRFDYILHRTRNHLLA